MVAFGKSVLPSFLETCKDMASATLALAQKRGHQIGQQQPQVQGEEPVQEQQKPEVEYIERMCVICGIGLVVPAESPFLVCNQCQTPQTADGQVLVPQPFVQESQQAYGRVE